MLRSWHFEDSYNKKLNESCHWSSRHHFFKLWGFYRCTAKLYHRNSLPNARPDKLTHSPDCWYHLVHRGTSLQIPLYCCLMSKWTSLPHSCHSLRSSIDNSSTTQVNTKLTDKKGNEQFVNTKIISLFHRYKKMILRARFW